MFTEAKKVLQRKTQQIFLMKKCKTTEMEAVKGCTVRENRFALSDCHSYETVSYFSSLNFISLLSHLFPNFSIRTLFPLTRMEFCRLLFVQESLCKWYLKTKKKVKIPLLGLRLLPISKVKQSTRRTFSQTPLLDTIRKLG